ncbi:MAG: hypothetical protein Kow00120_29370 [Anaerolineae bacterium]
MPDATPAETPDRALLVATDDAGGPRAGGDIITEADAARLRAAGAEADRLAASDAARDYLSRKASNTRKTHAEALATFADCLDELAGAGANLRAFADAVRDFPDAPLDLRAWAGVSWGIVTAFVRWQLRQGFAVASVNLRLSVVKVYCRLAFQAGVIGAEAHALIRQVAGYSPKEIARLDEGRELHRTGYKKAEPVRLTVDQAAALKARPDTPQGRRDRLLMCLLLDHGLRVSEVVALTVDALDLEAGEMAFYRRKVDKAQKHKLSADTLAAARRWLETDAPAEGLLLRGSRKGGRLTHAGMTPRAVTARVRDLGAALGIEGLSAHDCRHFWATYWADRVERLPRGVFTLQEAGGWASLDMPRRYVELSKIANEGMT